MRIAFFAQRVPYPPDRGDKITTCNEVAFLASRHEVEVFCTADGFNDLANAEALRARVRCVHVEPVHAASARLRALASLATRQPFSIAYFHSSRLRRAFDRRHAERPFDAALIYSSSMAQFAEGATAIPRVMQFADLDSLKWQQYAARSRWPLRWLYGREARLLLAYERRIAHEFSHSLVCTPLELADFRRLIPGAPVSCVANGVDLEYFRPEPQGQRRAANIVFTGMMDYLPNVDAVDWFARCILPVVRERVPEATFTICGARPSVRVRALSDLPGVEVTGRVEDVRPYVARAAACVVPLRMARGIQNKLLEAMAMGRACVVTPEAAAGLEPAARPAVTIGNGEQGFAAATSALLENPAAAAALGAKARSAVETLYRWDTQLDRLERILLGVPPAPQSVSH